MYTMTRLRTNILMVQLLCRGIDSMMTEDGIQYSLNSSLARILREFETVWYQSVHATFFYEY